MIKDEPMSSDAHSYASLYKALDEQTRAGKLVEARRTILQISPKSIPREWAPSFGELGFRLQVPMFTLKVLHRFVYPENQFATKSTEKERMIFASALFSLGASTEARVLLKEMNSEENPEVLFYSAIAHFTDWNYSESIPLLMSFIASKQVTEYRRLVAKVNLSAALIFCESYFEAENLIAQIQSECKQAGHHLLLGNSYELMAQCHIYQKRFDEALESLERAGQLLNQQSGLFSLFIEKWMAIAGGLKHRTRKELLGLREVRKKAVEMRHWNSVRECDLFEAVITHDRKLIRKLVLGCPSQSYRRRVRKLFGEPVAARGSEVFLIGSTHGDLDEDQQKQIAIFDPFESKVKTQALFKKPMLMALFDSLTQDFYKPSHLGFIFQNIYPGEKFDPFSSPSRVLQLLRRLDSWFMSNGSGLRVEFRKSEFRLRSEAPIFVKIQREVPVSANEAKFSELRNHFSERSFNAAQVQEKLQISRSSAERLLDLGVATGHLVAPKQVRNRMFSFAGRKKWIGEAA